MYKKINEIKFNKTNKQKKEWLPRQGLYFPAKLACMPGGVTSPHQWNVSESRVCAFWEVAFKKGVGLLSVRLGARRRLYGPRGWQSQRWEEAGSLNHHMEESCP